MPETRATLTNAICFQFSKPSELALIDHVVDDSGAAEKVYRASQMNRYGCGAEATFNGAVICHVSLSARFLASCHWVPSGIEVCCRGVAFTITLGSAVSPLFSSGVQVIGTPAVSASSM